MSWMIGQAPWSRGACLADRPSFRLAAVGILIGGSVLAVVVAILATMYEPAVVMTRAPHDSVALTGQQERERNTWRMPPLSELPPARLTRLNRVWLIVLRGYLIVAAGLVLVRIVQLAMAGA